LLWTAGSGEEKNKAPLSEWKAAGGFVQARWHSSAWDHLFVFVKHVNNIAVSITVATHSLGKDQED